MPLALALAFALTLQEPTAPRTVTSGNTRVSVPDGWKYEHREEGFFLRPGDLNEGESYVVIIPPGQKADGNLAEGFEKSWTQAVGRKKIVKKAPPRELKTEGGVDGLMSVGFLETADGDRLITAVAVFKAAERFEAVLALSSQDHVFQRYSGPLGAILKGIRFRNVELPDYDVLLSMGYTEKAGVTTVYAVFKDGTWLPTFPKEGMDGFDAATARKGNEEAWGSHELKNGVLVLRVGSREESLKPQADGSYRTAEGAQYLRIPPSTGLKLNGRFVLHGRDDASLLFKADGTFEDRGGGAAFLAPDDARAATGTAGRYEIAYNTLSLKYADGKLRRVFFIALPKPGDVEFILLNGRWLRRG